ncbi:MAG: hypothetical protein H6576_11365 [Lewinellaceae bacterium]|nr:hypothetical protein [Saprospiraceae bacterium]MCB9344290.1 hypothetical protein [Lewinellaceae bacterium]
MKNLFSIKHFLALLSFLVFTIQASALLAEPSCDTIKLKNGGLLYVEVMDKRSNEILVRPCEQITNAGIWVEPENLARQVPEEDEAEPLHLGGPRIGFAFFSGNFAERIQDPLSQGGLNARPVMSQFGYQFETAYISNEKVQVLFEFVPSITGLDQGKFLPTLSILNGVRFNKSGWEFIVGPILYMTKRAEGFFDAEGDWMLLSEYRANNPGEPDPDGTTKAFDARGNFGITSSFLLSIGKNFKAGNINFPVNLIAIPHPEGYRFGVSVGFNKQR